MIKTTIQKVKLKVRHRMSRFPELSDEAARLIIIEKDAKATQKATQVAWNAFKSWCDVRQLKIDAEKITKTELDKVLSKFYLELRKQEGNLYAKTMTR